MNLKLKFFIIYILFNLTSLFCQSYKIKNIDFQVKGKTQIEFLNKKVKIDTTKEFNSEDEIKIFIANLKQEYENLRLFEKIEITYSIAQPTSENTEDLQATHINLNVNLTDSKSTIILPYYKYDSNDGHVVKAKIKSDNFLGKIEELESEISFGVNPKDDSSLDFLIGAEFIYSLPFFIGPIEALWNNDLGINYTIGKDIPEWNGNTGFTFRLPFENISYELTLTQKFINDFDYEIYDDSMYLGEEINFSIPITLENFKKYGKLVYTPSINFTYNWQTNDKINIKNDDLISPELLFSNQISLGKINWIGNFRSGLSIYGRQDAGYNFYLNDMVFGIETGFRGSISKEKFGLNSRILFFSYFNKNIKIGEYIRGIRDDEYFNLNTSLNDINSTSSSSGIVINLDFPITLIKTDFEKWGFNFLKKLNFELQINPFIDIALSKNRVTERFFSLKDGFYTAGIEFIVFPNRWKSLQVRASAGFDIGRILFKDFIDSSWRPNPSPYELSFGIGLHY